MIKSSGDHVVKVNKKSKASACYCHCERSEAIQCQEVNKSKVKSEELGVKSSLPLKNLSLNKQTCHAEFISASSHEGNETIPSSKNNPMSTCEGGQIPNQVRNDILVGTRSNNQKLKLRDHFDHSRREEHLITSKTLKHSSQFTPHSSQTKRAAFTLAEVLITLGIIGVVAALTLPTLTANQRKKEVETKLKKVYSVMNNAINLSVEEYGNFEHWGEDGECGLAIETNCSSPEETKRIFNKYIGKHLQVLKIEDGTTTQNNGILVYLTDGSILEIYSYIRDMTFYINQKAYNNEKAGVNSFKFRFAPWSSANSNIRTRNKLHLGKGFEPYSFDWDGTRAGLFHEEQGYGCGEEVSFYCAKLIQQNGWKIPDDYPFTF